MSKILKSHAVSFRHTFSKISEPLSQSRKCCALQTARYKILHSASRFQYLKYLNLSIIDRTKNTFPMQGQRSSHSFQPNDRISRIPAKPVSPNIRAPANSRRSPTIYHTTSHSQPPASPTPRQRA